MSDDLLQPGNTTRRIQSGGRERSYHVHVPPGHDGARPMPVVLAFHGATSNGRLMEVFCGLSDQADQEGFLAVYLNGTGNQPNVLTWNGGDCCGYAKNNQVDDVAFVHDMLADLAKVAAADPARIYAAGMSNGAQMVYRLAAEMADRIAAVAAVAGPMGLETVRPARPISVLHFHGTDDRFAPYQGGVGERSVYGASFRSVEHTIRAWIHANECPPEPRVEFFPDKVGDGTVIWRKTYGPGKAGSEVALVVVEDGGHTWPGRPPLPAQLGKSTMNISANDWIWQFFLRHPLRY
jgi:polyhydroxybutyrate depolymerase